jgi:hypothetical protein
MMVGSAGTGQASQQTVDHGSHPHQVGDRAGRAGRVRRGDGAVFYVGRMFSGTEISPIGRNEKGIGVRRGEQEIPSTASAVLTKNNNDFPFQTMAGTDDRYLLWERVVVGSLSSDRSTELTTIASWPELLSGYPTSGGSNSFGRFSMPG